MVGPCPETGRTTIWTIYAKTRTWFAIGFFVRRPPSGLQGRLLPALKNCWGRKGWTAHRTSHLARAAKLLVRSSASVAPLTCWVPSDVSRAAAAATFLTRRSLVLAKHVSISLLLLFKQLRHTKTRKAARVAVTPRVVGRDKTTAHKNSNLLPNTGR